MEKNQLLPIYEKLAVSFYLYEYKYRNSLLAFYKMIWYIWYTRKENTQPHSSQPFFQYISYNSSNFKLDLILGKVAYKQEICNYNLNFQQETFHSGKHFQNYIYASLDDLI